MSTITWPASLVPKTASLRLQTVQRVHASPFGGSEQTVDLLNDRWMLSLTLTQRAGFWKLRDEMSAAQKPEGGSIKHDISVPVAAVPAFIEEANAAVVKLIPGARPVPFGHLGDGNVHFHVRAPRGSDPADWYAHQVPRVSAFVHDLVVAAGGSISAEHGIGQMKRAELERLSSPARMGALRAIKRALDPQLLFNPGKLVSFDPPVAG